jgi:hypothetical protein
MREANIKTRLATIDAQGEARAESPPSGRRQTGVAAPRKRRAGTKAKSLNPTPWCKHPAAADFGKLCRDQLKAYKV